MYSVLIRPFKNGTIFIVNVFISYCVDLKSMQVFDHPFGNEVDVNEIANPLIGFAKAYVKLCKAFILED